MQNEKMNSKLINSFIKIIGLTLMLTGCGGVRMDEEIEEEITLWVRMGFNSSEELLEIFCEEMYEPDELDEKEVKTTIRLVREQILLEQVNWPTRTDCDRLDSVFDRLNSQNIIALQNAGYTQSDGYSDITEAFHDSVTKSEIQGYCFYHGQDLERAVRGEGLTLSFGPIDPNREELDGPIVGTIIVQELEKEGFIVKWDGTFGQRILVENLDWKKRIK
ncbi:hypothetical protein P4C99_16410 [Pontiellaceae bacterium B1224]|nr:hypothetical protein [Pontiellaceae bacterium B1224]